MHPPTLTGPRRMRLRLRSSGVSTLTMTVEDALFYENKGGAHFLMSTCICPVHVEIKECVGRLCCHWSTYGGMNTF